MPKKTAIPVNYFGDEFDSGVVIEKIAFKELPNFNEWGHAERHDRHSFFFLETGSVTIEIDFKKYKIKPATVIYMHPSQVHRILAFKNVTVTSMALNNESLNTGYLKLLEEIAPAKPLLFNKAAYNTISAAITLCLKCSAQNKSKLHHAILKDSCNTLIGLVISQYLEQGRSTGALSRFEIVTRAFKELLEQHFATMKSPTAYAKKLNITTPYLNECVKHTTGQPVSHHIQQRVVLEAKRLLYHSNRSVKEIASDLGYDDHAYFSRLFAKIARMPALAFRNKNLD